MIDDNPYRSPNTREPPAEKTPNQKRSDWGCLFLFLFSIPLLDAFGMLISFAGPYGPLILVVGLGGFACGAALGAYVSGKIMQRPWRASWYWAMCGLIGMTLSSVIVFLIVVRYMPA